MFSRTNRLLLRPGFMEDAPVLARLMADKGIAMATATIPHPYSEADARKWLATPPAPGLPRCLIVLRTGGAPVIVGGIALDRSKSGSVELGYWVARSYWGRGIATEAAKAVIEMARTVGVRRIHAGHFLDNPASGRVLEKLGFRPNGRVSAITSCARSEPAAARHLELDLDEADIGWATEPETEMVAA